VPQIRSLRDGIPVMLFWQDTSDEVVRRGMTIAEVFEMKSSPPIGLVHAYEVTLSREEGFNAPHIALCGFEAPPGGLRAQRLHEFESERECRACRSRVLVQWGDDAWRST
jgi:hypothetical protein